MNKIIIIFLFLVLISSFGFSLKIEPFVSFPGETVLMELDSEAEAEIEYYFNLNEVEKCKPATCPLFENNLLKDSGKKEFEINIGNSKAGSYAIKITEENSDDFYYSSINVRPDYRPLIIVALIVLIGLVIAVGKNVI